jgi:hypothetical protein
MRKIGNAAIDDCGGPAIPVHSTLDVPIARRHSDLATSFRLQKRIAPAFSWALFDMIDFRRQRIDQDVHEIRNIILGEKRRRNNNNQSEMDSWKCRFGATVSVMLSTVKGELQVP